MSYTAELSLHEVDDGPLSLSLSPSLSLLSFPPSSSLPLCSLVVLPPSHSPLFPDVYIYQLVTMFYCPRLVSGVSQDMLERMGITHVKVCHLELECMLSLKCSSI